MTGVVSSAHPPSVLVLQHAAAEHAGSIGEALRRAGCVLRRCNVSTGDDLPDINPDALVVMGGPQAAYDDAGFATRRREIDLIAHCVSAGIPVLGVCLGAQLLAAACGGRALRGNGAEIGWGDVTLSDVPDRLFDGVGPTLPVLHWHADTFDPPAGSVVLATSPRYVQAFRVGDRAWGLQFHLEVDEAIVAAFVAADPGGAVQGGGSEIVTEAPRYLSALEPVARLVARRFAELVIGAPAPAQSTRVTQPTRTSEAPPG